LFAASSLFVTRQVELVQPSSPKQTVQKQLEDLNVNVTTIDFNDRRGLSVLIDHRTNSPKVIALLPALNDLLQLSLADMTIDVAEVNSISGHKNLCVLSFFYCTMKDKALDRLKDLPHLNAVTFASVKELKDEDLKKMSSFSTLSSMSFRDCRIKGTGIHYLNVLKTLTDVTFDKCDITDKSLKDLEQLRHLKTICIYGNRSPGP
jgi:hypothetical protein